MLRQQETTWRASDKIGSVPNVMIEKWLHEVDREQRRSEDWQRDSIASSGASCKTRIREIHADGVKFKLGYGDAELCRFTSLPGEIGDYLARGDLTDKVRRSFGCADKAGTHPDLQGYGTTFDRDG